MSIAQRDARSGCSRRRTSRSSTHTATAAAPSIPSTGASSNGLPTRWPMPRQPSYARPHARSARCARSTSDSSATTGAPAPSRRSGACSSPLRAARLVVIGVLVLVAGGVAFAARAAAPDLHADGPEDGALLDGEALASLSFSSRRRRRRLESRRQAGPAAARGRPGRLRARRLPDGPHEVVLRTHRRLLGSAEKRFRFVVDTAAPTLAVDGPAVVGRGAPLRLAGTARAARDPARRRREPCPWPATGASSCVSRRRRAASFSPPPTRRGTGAAGACR